MGPHRAAGGLDVPSMPVRLKGNWWGTWQGTAGGVWEWGWHTPLLASWYLRLAWVLSRTRLRYCAFSFSISCCVVCRGGAISRAGSG